LYFSQINITDGGLAQLVTSLVASTKLNIRRARLVLGWVTVCRRVNYLGM